MPESTNLVPNGASYQVTDSGSEYSSKAHHIYFLMYNDPDRFFSANYATDKLHLNGKPHDCKCK